MLISLSFCQLYILFDVLSNHFAAEGDHRQVHVVGVVNKEDDEKEDDVKKDDDKEDDNTKERNIQEDDWIKERNVSTCVAGSKKGIDKI